jgi:hypothetical protein
MRSNQTGNKRIRGLFDEEDANKNDSDTVEEVDNVDD